MLFLALSCLQGRPMAAAAAELLDLGAVGLQLTPGCAPTAGFEQLLAQHEIATRTHHGFHFEANRQDVWHECELLSTSDSVHPPQAAGHTSSRRSRSRSAGPVRGRAPSSTITDTGVDPAVFLTHLASGGYGDVALETMYPGHCLGTGAELEAAMDTGVLLAVDVSHVFMQLCMQAMVPATWERLQSYEFIAEVHLSSNDGSRDQHRTVDSETFGFDWAVTRAAAGTPLVLENYMHRDSEDDRRAVVHAIQSQIQRREQ